MRSRRVTEYGNASTWVFRTRGRQKFPNPNPRFKKSISVSVPIPKFWKINPDPNFHLKIFKIRSQSQSSSQNLKKKKIYLNLNPVPKFLWFGIGSQSRSLVGTKLFLKRYPILINSRNSVTVWIKILIVLQRMSTRIGICLWVFMV